MDHASDNTQKVEQNSEDEKEQTNGSKRNTNLKKTLSNNEILSQAILFFIAGHETTANTLNFIAYNLAVHFGCQQKLIHEIDNVLEKYVSSKIFI